MVPGLGAFSHKLECSTLVDASKKYLFFHEGVVYFGGNETSVHFLVKGGVVFGKVHCLEPCFPCVPVRFQPSLQQVLQATPSGQPLRGVVVGHYRQRFSEGRDKLNKQIVYFLIVPASDRPSSSLFSQDLKNMVQPKPWI